MQQFMRIYRLFQIIHRTITQGVDRIGLVCVGRYHDYRAIRKKPASVFEHFDAGFSPKSDIHQCQINGTVHQGNGLVVVRRFAYLIIGLFKDGAVQLPHGCHIFNNE